MALTPAAGVVELARDDDTVTVGPETKRGEESYEAEYTVSRTEEVSENRTSKLIPEQAFRDARLRNTLPFFEDGVETVRLTSGIDGRRPLFENSAHRNIEYDGEHYEAGPE
ncbi:hypothetical protein AUR64_05090 [Haloprofundus marisrubri]|uniref:Uncharacterized protein n=1 Tax=Haloprofundus marisrubri TaxID=1514971 RepID=A0A0W1RCU8_9EURY|nr:hypothetical protein AUR64_05090 [Haloprofundus marisrubri]